jgi:hypothetical protein
VKPAAATPGQAAPARAGDPADPQRRVIREESVPRKDKKAPSDDEDLLP